MKKIISGTLIYILISCPSFAANTLKPITLATFELPPFVSEEMPEQGAGAYALKRIFEEMGYKLTLKILPARRAQVEALRSSEMLGYVPASEYDPQENIVLSKPFHQSQTLLVQHKDRPIDWTDVNALSKYRGGNVRGYFLKGPMKVAQEQGKLNMEESPSDILNLIKLGKKRLDFIVINDGMLGFLMADPRLKAYATKIEVNPKKVADVFWGIAFKAHDQKSKQVMAEFNEKIDPKKFPKYVEEYLRKAKSSESEAKITK